MKRDEYDRFSQALEARLIGDARALGLVALGSFAKPDLRDEWSDHDFWLVTVPGAYAEFLDDLAWLPDAAEIVLALRAGAHYYTLLYRNGHQVEFGAFDLDTLEQAKTNRYRLVFDHGGVAGAVESIAQRTRAEHQTGPDLERSFAYLLTTLCVAAARSRRGETLSAHQYLFGYALNDLLSLIVALLPAEQSGDRLDGFDPRRRFEQAYPSLAAEIARLLRQTVEPAALGLLDLAERLFARQPAYPEAAARAVRRYLEGAGPAEHA